MRQKTCFQCVYMGMTYDKNGKHNETPEICDCNVTNQCGSLTRGYTCSHFQYKQWHNATAADGTMIKNRHPEDYRTEKQWIEAGRKLKPDAIGVEMYASRHNMKTKYRYYLINETESE